MPVTPGIDRALEARTLAREVASADARPDAAADGDLRAGGDRLRARDDAVARGRPQLRDREQVAAVVAGARGAHLDEALVLRPLLLELDGHPRHAGAADAAAEPHVAAPRHGPARAREADRGGQAGGPERAVVAARGARRVGGHRAPVVARVRPQVGQLDGDRRGARARRLDGRGLAAIARAGAVLDPVGGRAAVRVHGGRRGRRVRRDVARPLVGHGGRLGVGSGRERPVVAGVGASP